MKHLPFPPPLGHGGQVVPSPVQGGHSTLLHVAVQVHTP